MQSHHIAYIVPIVILLKCILYVFDSYGQVANSVHVIGLWRHLRPASLWSVYSDSGYITNGENFIGGMYIDILPP